MNPRASHVSMVLVKRTLTNRMKLKYIHQPQSNTMRPICLSLSLYLSLFFSFSLRYAHRHHCCLYDWPMDVWPSYAKEENQCPWRDIYFENGPVQPQETYDHSRHNVSCSRLWQWITRRRCLRRRQPSARGPEFWRSAPRSTVSTNPRSRTRRALVLDALLKKNCSASNF